MKELKSSQANVQNAITEMQSQVEALKQGRLWTTKEDFGTQPLIKTITFISWETPKMKTEERWACSAIRNDK